MKDRYGLAGRIVADKYQIEALVGVGGMSAVYTAQQIGVGRRVAFKILLPHLANNAHHVANLFEREAKTAGQLSHENIATIFDAGYTTDEIAYIAMEWVDGQTLEDEIAQQGHLTLERTAAILRQICAALDLAHSKLIIHRDLKPSNIMLSRRQDGQEQVKVLDFGLAKLANEAKDVLVSTAVGTPHYASPEQFQTGAEIDARTDIYALGVTLYQMLTGRLPFNSGSVHEVIRQHMLEVPPAIRELRPDVPPAVEELVQRMMAKNPHYRPQKAGEVIFLFERALALMSDEALAPEFAPEIVPMMTVTGATNHLTGQLHVPTPTISNGFNQPSANPFQSRSQRTATANQFQVRTLREELNARTSLLEESTSNYPSLSDLATSALKTPGGPRLQWFKQHKIVGALVVLALVVGSSFGVFFAAKPYLNEKDTVLVADFINNTGDEVFDIALKHALSVQLAQSPFLNLFAEEKVKETLRFMGRKPDERLTREVAREIGQRQGLKAIIVGRIDRIGNNFSISLQAINSVTGDTFGDTFSEARNKEQVLQALGQASTEFRKKLGESLSSIEKFNKPIQDATTSSLDALKAYSLGREQSALRGNPTEALALYRRAVELDPNFALAYVGLATLYANKGEAELAAENAEQAFRLIDRISETERFSAWFTYHFLVKADVGKAIETLKLARQTYPNNPNTINNLAVCYGSIGEFEAALNSSQEAISLDPRNISAQVNRAELQLRFSRFKEAKDAINELLARKIDRIWMHTALYQIGLIQNDPALMQQQLNWVLGRQDEALALDWQAQVAAYKGKLREAVQLYERAIEINKQRQLQDQAAAGTINLAVRQAAFGFNAEALQRLNEALALSHNNFVKRPLGDTAPFGTFALALAGDPQQAILLCEESAQKYPRNTLANNLWIPVTNAAIQLNQGQPAKAIELLRTAAPHDPVAAYVSVWLRGQAYLQLNKGREAAGEFQRILSNRGWNPTSVFYPLAQLGLARAYALLGDSNESRKHYAGLFEVWKDADPDLPILQAAKREYAALR